MPLDTSPRNRCLARTRWGLTSAATVAALLLALPRAPSLRAAGVAAPPPQHPPAARPELELQVGHLGSADSVAFSPDGKTIASCGSDNKLRLWEVASGTVQRVLTGHTTLAWSPDGTLLASAGDGTIQLWDPRTGKLQRTLNSPAASIAFSPDGKTLASGLPQSVKLWDVRTGALIRELPAGDGNAWSLPVAFSPDSRRLVVASRPDVESQGSGSPKPVSGQLTLWDLATGVVKWSVTRRGKEPLYPAAVAFSADGKTIATGEWGYGAGMPIGVRERPADIDLWDVETGSLQRTLTGQLYAVVSLAFSPDGQTLFSAGFDCRIGVWDVHTGARLKTLIDGDSGGVMALTLSPDGRTLGAAYAEGEVRLWDTQTGRLRRTLGWGNPVISVAVSPDGKLIASGSLMKPGLRVWDARTGALQWIPAGQMGGAPCVAFTPDGRVLACAGSDGTVRRWDTRTRAELRAIEGQPGPHWFALSPDGKLLARPGTDKEYWIWDLETEEPVRTLPGHNPLGPGVAFSADGNTVATCSASEEEDAPAEIRFWDARSWKPLRTLNAPIGPILGFALSPDGTTLATGCPPVIRLWDVETGELKRTLQGYRGPGLVFSPDGKLLASSDSTRIDLWRVVTGTRLRSLEGHAGINSLSFSPDGQRLVSGADDHIRVLEVSTGRLLARLITLPPARPDQGLADWLAITSDGYYDGSPGAARHISWKVGSDLFPLEAYEKTFHRPDLLRRALASAPIAATPQHQRFEAGQAIPPQVTITRPHDGQTVTGNTVRVEVTITDDRRVVRVEVRVNGRPVATKPIVVGGKPIILGSKPLEVGAKSILITGLPIPAGARPITVGAKPLPAAHRFLQQLSTEVPLPPGESQVTLKAVATDSDALQGWDELRLRRPSAAPAVARAAELGDLYVLAIGVSRYQNPHYNLKYAAADATAFAGLWKPMERSLYDHVLITALTDAQATTDKIQSELFKLLRTVSRKDSVALFLSGHGVQAGDGQFYFATHDIDATSPQRVQETALPWTVFETILAKVEAKRVFLFLDACHSGSVLGEQEASNERLAEALARHGNVLVFSSSRGGEYSYEEPALQHGAFTQALLEGIGEGKADLTIGGRRDGRITAAKLLAYLQARVPELTDNRQTPTCPLLYDFGEEFLLARAR